MDIITSRKNYIVSHFRSLGSDRAYRRLEGEYLCEGMKMLEDALLSGAEVTAVVSSRQSHIDLPPSLPHYRVPTELMDYISPLKNSPGPVFAVKIQSSPVNGTAHRVIILDTVQDPGNVGTIIRTANALAIDMVILTGQCADLYNPKTVRATMGAVFRQRVSELAYEEIRPFLDRHGLFLYGAALSNNAADIRSIKPNNAAVAIGSEGRGLSDQMLEICDSTVIIPMDPESESLNAATAAAIIMWELVR